MIIQFIKTYELNSIQIFKSIKYNFLCRCIKRYGKGILVPFKNSVIKLDKTAELHLNGPLILNKNCLGKKAVPFRSSINIYSLRTPAPYMLSKTIFL